MIIVTFNTVDDNGDLQVVGTAKMKDGKVIVKCSIPQLEEDIKKTKIMGLDKKWKTIDDGEDFWEALPLNYTGTRFFAQVKR